MNLYQFPFLLHNLQSRCTYQYLSTCQFNISIQLHVYMKQLLLALLFCLSICQYQVVTSQKQLRAALQKNSQKPALVSYEKSATIIDAQKQLFQEVEYLIRDFAMLIIADCSASTNLKSNQTIPNCPHIVQNPFPIVYVYGVKPLQHLLYVKGKAFQLTPEIKEYKGNKQSPQLVQFAETLIPNYIHKTYSRYDYLQHLSAGNLQVPKLVYNGDDDDQLLLLRKLAVKYLNRIDFMQLCQPGLIQDAPKLYIMQFDFAEDNYTQHVYNHKIVHKDYHKLSSFIQQHASPASIPKLYHYLTVSDNKVRYADLKTINRTLYEIDQWILVYQSADTSQAQQVISLYQTEYSDYLRYVIFKNESQLQARLYFKHLPQHLLSLTTPELPPQQHQTFEQLQSHAQTLMDLHYTVIIVEPSLYQICSLAELRILVHLVACLPVLNQDVQKVKHKFNLAEEDRLAIVFKQNQKGEFRGVNLKKTDFMHVLSELYRSSSQKVIAIAKEFITHPIFTLQPNEAYSEQCRGTCLIYLHNRQSPIEHELNQIIGIAYRHNTWLTIFEGDIRCNDQLFRQMGKSPQNSIVLFKADKYYVLKDKISLENIEKVVRAYKKFAIKWKQLSKELKTNQVCPYKLAKRTKQTKLDSPDEQL